MGYFLGQIEYEVDKAIPTNYPLAGESDEYIYEFFFIGNISLPGFYYFGYRAEAVGGAWVRLVDDAGSFRIAGKVESCL